MKLERRTNRLQNYDYSRPATYYVTIVTHRREHHFGQIINGEVALNEYGIHAEKCWLDIPTHFPNLVLDEYVIMPNHIHGIITIVDHTVGAGHAPPLRQLHTATRIRVPTPWALGVIVGGFKSAVTKIINRSRRVTVIPIWQRNYYEHIIRDDEDLERTKQYIRDNPKNWKDDELSRNITGS